MTSIDLDYAALTVDTSVFMSNGLSFDRGLLKQLDQFKKGPVQLIISDVVVCELRKHMIERVAEARTKLHSALKATKAHFESPAASIEEAMSHLLGDRTDELVVEAKLNDFIERTGAQIVSCKNISTEDLVSLYFDCSPPFEAARDKKTEFPDAIALLSIEAWAKEKGLQVLAASEDRGWIDFANNSDFIDASPDLAKVLTHFQPHNAALEIIESIKTVIEGGAEHEILDDIVELIVEATNEADLDVAFTSSIHAEPQYTEVLYTAHQFEKDQTGRPMIDLVRIEESWLVLRLQVSVQYQVDAWFSMSVWDSIDKEYVSLGSTKARRTGTVTSDLLLSLTADFTRGLEGVKVGELSLDLDFPIVDVGDIEPNFHDD